MTLNPQTLSWLKDYVYVGPGSGYGSIVMELGLRLLLSLLTADSLSMIQMCKDLKQALTEEGFRKLIDNTWILVSCLVGEDSKDLNEEDITKALASVLASGKL
jgi:hypothetical protein